MEMEASVSGPEPEYSSVVDGYEKLKVNRKFKTSLGGEIDELQIAFETYGTLSEAKNNAILLTCGLSASSHAKSHDKNTRPGWWEEFIGPGLALDTDKFFVICTNNLGGCFGTSGPSSLNPATNERYGLSFPLFTVDDMVKAMFYVVDYLGIERLHAIVGSSLGGMQSLCAAAAHPHRVRRLVSISSCAISHPLSIALRCVQRRILMADPNFSNGDYYDGPFPSEGMCLAREIATVTYRSGPEWERRFGRKRRDDVAPTLREADFMIEAYLDHQGRKWCGQFDPNSMLYISKAMDLFSMERLNSSGVMDLREGLKPITMPTLIIGAQSDYLFPIWQQKHIADILRENGNSCVAYFELDSLYGHDTFLIDVVNVGAAVKGHLEQKKAWCK